MIVSTLLFRVGVQALHSPADETVREMVGALVQAGVISADAR